jgi:hypothetical protein
VTKGHSLYIEGVLIPVEFLINHRSICWDDEAREVHLYHIELETHDVLLANGAPAESYRDDGNRWLFQNASSGWGLPPQEPCAPVLTGGPIVDAVWRRLFDRAAPGERWPLTDDPDLHLLVDGKVLRPRRSVGNVHTFELEAPPDRIRIISRAAAPQEVGFARDPRTLGVALRQVRLWKGRLLRVLGADDAAWEDGCHAFEEDNGIRWTDGDAAIPSGLFEGFSGAVELSLHLGCATLYPAPMEFAAKAA